MKIIQRCFIVLFILLLSVPALAQKNSVVGKWTIVSLDVEGISINLEKPEESKLIIASQIEKQKGSKPDSAVIENAYASLSSMFEGMILEFTTTGKGIYYVDLPNGEVQKDTANYTVDYASGILNLISIVEGSKKKDIITFKFDGDYMTLVNDEKKETIKIKRSK